MQNAYDRPIGSRLRAIHTGEVFKKFTADWWQRVGEEWDYPETNQSLQRFIDLDCMEEVASDD